MKVVEACNCKGPKFPTRNNKNSRSRSTQSSSSKQRKVPDSSGAVHALKVERGGRGGRREGGRRNL